MTKSMKQMETVAIVGAGLIGGSIGKALLQRRLAKNVIGIGRRAASLRRAREVGAVTATSRSIARGVADAELVIVCTPVDLVAEHVLQVADACGHGTLITDAGSTKAQITETVESQLPPNARFIGSHPMAGSEKTGAAHAQADLFEDRVVIVTPTKKTSPKDFNTIQRFWRSIGARVIRMTPDAHDRAVAATSHLPRLVAAALAASTSSGDLPLTATGWADSTRVAAGDPGLWESIFATNREHVLGSLGQFEKTLAQLRKALENKNDQQLVKILTKAKSLRDAVGN